MSGSHALPRASAASRRAGALLAASLIGWAAWLLAERAAERASPVAPPVEVPLAAGVLLLFVALARDRWEQTLAIYVGLAAAVVAGPLLYPDWQDRHRARLVSLGLSALLVLTYEVMRRRSGPRARPFDLFAFVLLLAFFEHFFYREVWAPYSTWDLAVWGLLVAGLGVSFRIGTADVEAPRLRLRESRPAPRFGERTVLALTGAAMLAQAVLAIGSKPEWSHRGVHPAAWLLCIAVGVFLVFLACERPARRRRR